VVDGKVGEAIAIIDRIGRFCQLSRQMAGGAPFPEASCILHDVECELRAFGEAKATLHREIL
jgi:hypothetical protein